VAKKWLDDFVADLKPKGLTERIVRSSLGRSRLFDGEFGRRECRGAKATLLQQVESHLLKVSLVSTTRSPLLRLDGLGMPNSEVTVIHDEVYVEAPEDEAKPAGHSMGAIMENAVDISLYLWKWM